MRKNTWTKGVTVAAICLIMAAGAVSCVTDGAGEQSNASPQTLEVETASWEENESVEGCKLTASFPVDTTSYVSRNVKEWISEQLGGTYEGNIHNGKAMMAFYGQNYVDSLQSNLAELGVSASLEASTYYVQFKKVFETGQLVSYTTEVYQYSGGAHGSEVLKGCLFRKPDGRMLGWEMFTLDAQEKLRGMLKERLKNNYFKVRTDEDFFNMLLVDNARYYFPLPESAPIFRPNGVEFVYQQYEIAPYAAGLPSCVIPYESLRGMFTATMNPLVESVNDSIARAYNPVRLR